MNTHVFSHYTNIYSSCHTFYKHVTRSIDISVFNYYLLCHWKMIYSLVLTIYILISWKFKLTLISLSLWCLLWTGRNSGEWTERNAGQYNDICGRTYGQWSQSWNRVFYFKIGSNDGWSGVLVSICKYYFVALYFTLS